MKRYEQAKKDYEYLVSHHGGHCNDITGGFVADEKFFQLLKNPTKSSAYLLYCGLITHFADCGVESYSGANSGDQPDFEDEEVCNIFRRNCDEESVMVSWGVDISEDCEEG